MAGRASWQAQVVTAFYAQEPASAQVWPWQAENSAFGEYRSMVRRRLHRTIRSSFPRLVGLVGETQVTDWVDRWLEESPPSSRFFYRVATEFGEWLVDGLDDASAATMARFESTVLELRDQALDAPQRRAWTLAVDFDFEGPAVMGVPWRDLQTPRDPLADPAESCLAEAPVGMVLWMWRDPGFVIRRGWWPDWLVGGLVESLRDGSPLSEALEKSWGEVDDDEAQRRAIAAARYLRPLIEADVLRTCGAV